MGIMNKTKEIINIIKGDTKEKKLEIILDHLIDNIELRDNIVYIKTKKNIAIENEGHTVLINSGQQVLIADKIQLNPDINFNDTNFNELESRLLEAEEKVKSKIQKIPSFK